MNSVSKRLGKISMQHMGPKCHHQTLSPPFSTLSQCHDKWPQNSPKELYLQHIVSQMLPVFAMKALQWGRQPGPVITAAAAKLCRRCTAS